MLFTNGEKEITKETAAFYLKMLKTLYQYSMRKISKDTGVKIDSLYSVTGDSRSSERNNVYVMYKLRQTYPNEMSSIDSAAVAISESAKEGSNDVHIQTI